MPKIVFTLLLFAAFSLNFAQADNTCAGKKITICHKGDKDSHDAQELCIDISGLNGHIIQHDKDTIGSCREYDPKLIKAYACNAGLKYNVNLGVTCIRHDDNGLIASDCGTSTNCTCSQNPQSEDSYLLNNMRYASSAYNEDFDLLNFIERFKVASKTDTFNQVSLVLGAEVLKGDSALQFNLGAERYGAEYFIDMCVRNDNLDPGMVPLDLTGNILYSGGIFTQQSYPQASKLTHQMAVYCDPNSSGSYSLASYPFFSQQQIPFLYGQRDFTTQVPGSRFCIVRHSFKETEDHKMRGNRAKKATFQANLSVAGSLDGTTVSQPVSLCKIQEIKKDTFACTSIEFTNSTEFKNFILANYGKGTSSDFQKDFKDIYNNKCPNPCSL